MATEASRSSNTLLPAEKVALTVALARLKRGESPEPNTAAMCVLGLARLAGIHDWTQDAEITAGPLDCPANEEAS